MKRHMGKIRAVMAGILIAFTLSSAEKTAALASPSRDVASASPSEAAILEGWRQEEGGWVYYDKDGGRAYDTWVKSKDGKTAYYLDESGFMATGRIIVDGTAMSYVDETGAQARDCWVSVANDGLWDEPVKNVYYYFDSKGKAYRDVKKKIDKKTYYFDSEGRMLSGWYEDDGDLYYLGTEDEGWVHTGWQFLVPEDPEESGGFERWFYFALNSGKAYHGRKKIDGFFHYFDENSAVMQEGWVEWEDKCHAYYEPKSGRMITGWVYCGGPVTDEEGWYYLDEDGVPYNEGGKDTKFDGDKYLGRGIDYLDVDIVENLAARIIDGDTYLFDGNGKMLTGGYYLWLVNRRGGEMLGPQARRDGESFIGGFYFFDNEDGADRGKMLIGRHKVKVNAADFEYYFDKDGRSYELYIIEGRLYDLDGSLRKAKDGDKYEIVEFRGEDEIIKEKGSSRRHRDCQMIVDRNGKVMKKGTVTIDGYKYHVENYEVVGEPEEKD